MVGRITQRHFFNKLHRNRNFQIIKKTQRLALLVIQVLIRQIIFRIIMDLNLVNNKIQISNLKFKIKTDNLKIKIAVFNSSGVNN